MRKLHSQRLNSFHWIAKVKIEGARQPIRALFKAALDS